MLIQITTWNGLNDLQGSYPLRNKVQPWRSQPTKITFFASPTCKGIFYLWIYLTSHKIWKSKDSINSEKPKIDSRITPQKEICFLKHFPKRIGDNGAFFVFSHGATYSVHLFWQWPPLPPILPHLLPIATIFTPTSLNHQCLSTT